MGFFRYTRLPRRESKQKRVNLVQLCDSTDGQWKDAQAQLQTVGLKMRKLHVHSQGPNFSKYSSKEENCLVNQSKKPKPNQKPTEQPTRFLLSTEFEIPCISSTELPYLRSCCQIKAITLLLLFIIDEQ